MNFHVLTLFPDMILSGLSASILGKAQEKKLLSVEAVNIRDFSTDKHKKVDDYPYGGGAGLLMQGQPVYDAYQYLTNRIGKKVRTVYLTPQGKVFNQRMAEEFSKEDELIFLCGHYEGIDERVLDEVVTDYVSLGDFVLTGGEMPAMIMIDAVARLIPGVLHNEGSATEESFSGYLLEYPQYSRPEVFMGKKVPKPLLSGNHKEIREWRLKAAEERTKQRRPDLYAAYEELLVCKYDLLKEKLHHIGMTELISRGQAELLYHDKIGTLLRDRVSGVCMLTVKNKESGIKILKCVFQSDQAVLNASDIPTFVTHQEFMNEYVMEFFDMHCISGCIQEVYTRKEALSQKNVGIRRLSIEHLDAIQKVYRFGEYIKERLLAGAMYGAFMDEVLAGFVGEHQEGSMGMLYVFPDFRRRGIAEALETDLINRTLQKGYIPFCQIMEQNEISKKLQDKLGLYPAKEKVWWFEI
ncbi:MAG TPA: tRNA (guanosine(37)-N1)-methyltransferase TrmD [Lachnospiraceae bacterium]|nr:tRNA (guanosine(37)-N1)-methyltransferase TrmD [Lachnospiraceae bacterium]